MKDYHKQIVNAAVQEDIETILSNNGLLDMIESGEIFCEICGVPISKDSIGALLIKDSKIVIICNNNDCIDRIKR